MQRCVKFLELEVWAMNKKKNWSSQYAWIQGKIMVYSWSFIFKFESFVFTLSELMLQ